MGSARLIAFCLALVVAPALASAEDDWVPVLNDPLLVPVEWAGEFRAHSLADASFAVLEDHLLEPWAADAERTATSTSVSSGAAPRAMDPCRSTQLACSCVCEDILTPDDWLR